jgi:hypothetical protein
MKEATMHMARRTALSVVLGSVVPVLMAGGCGDDSNGKLSTGVDKDKPLGGVSPAEAEQICRSTEIWAKRAIAESKQKELTCRISGLVVAGTAGLSPGGMGTTVSDAQLQMSCKATEDQCLATATPAPTGNAGMCPAFPAGCTATVAEYEACLNDVPPFVDQTASTLPRCETLNRLSLLSLLGLANSLPPSCRTFQMKCGGAGIPGIPGVPTPTGGTTGS